VSILVPVGSTRTIEFIADQLGDWPLHCHMTHHVMNQMGHGLPNTVGADLGRIDETLYAHVPAYGDMEGEMGAGGDHSSLSPPNSLPMIGGKGPYGTITMSGMFTILKVRESISEGVEPGWYEAPLETIARRATKEELERDGISG
jgi:hypothetical protein